MRAKGRGPGAEGVSDSGPRPSALGPLFMLVVVGIYEIHIPHAQSLKDKRMVVRSLKEKLRNRFEMSAAEVALQDLHQRARLAFSFIALDQAAADAALDRIHDFIESNTDAVVAGSTVEKLEFDEMVGL